MKRLTLVMIMLVLGAGALQAQTYETLNIIGYLYESDNTPGTPGFPPSDAGDVLAGLGFVDGFTYTPFFATADYEYTWILDGLVSQGAVDQGGGIYQIFYTGGTLDLVADEIAGAGYTPAFYGIDPPQPGAVASFSNGEVYLNGTMVNFVLTYDTNTSSGDYQGQVVFELGPNVGAADEELAYPTGLTIAGVLAADSTIPEGYDLEADGNIFHDPTVPNEDMTFSNVKQLFR